MNEREIWWWLQEEIAVKSSSTIQGRFDDSFAVSHFRELVIRSTARERNLVTPNFKIERYRKITGLTVQASISPWIFSPSGDELCRWPLLDLEDLNEDQWESFVNEDLELFRRPLAYELFISHWFLFLKNKETNWIRNNLLESLSFVLTLLKSKNP